MTKQATAKLRHLRMSPRKVRLLIDLIRGMKATEALKQLQFSKRDAARPVMKLLASAMANAEHNSGINPDTLVIKTATVDGGPILYRSMPRAMGRATPIRKRTSHIHLVLEGEAKAEKAPKAKTAKTDATEVSDEPKKEKTVKKTTTKKTIDKKSK